MKQYIKWWLGIAPLEVRINTLETEVAILTEAMFDETHPLRQAASSAIGERQIARMKAEDKARRHTLGEL